MHPKLPSSARALLALPLVLMLGATTGIAQNRAFVPPIAATLPGNAEVSMPLRWSQGVLQVNISTQLQPANFVGQVIQGVRMRRPALLDEPPYAGVQRTLTVRAAFTTSDPASLTPYLNANRPPAAQVVFGPAVVPVAATTPANGAQPIGAEFLVIPFTTPLPVVFGNLFLEFEAGDAPLAVGDAWVDAVWMQNGVDQGYTVAMGDRTCTTASPLGLYWTAAGGPLRGSTAQFTMFGARPHAATFAFVGVEPATRAPAPGSLFFGYGAALGALDPALANCYQWAPLDVMFAGTADSFGNYVLSFPITAALTTTRMRLGVQAGFFDSGRSGLPISLSNGQILQLDTADVASRCASVMFPGTITTSPWGPQMGLMPVLVLDY